MNEPLPAQSALPPSHEDELTWAEEFLDEDALDEREEEIIRPRSSRPYGFFAIMAIVGVALAFGWRYSGVAEPANQLYADMVEQASQLWSASTGSVQAAAPAAPAAAAPPATAKADDQSLAPLWAELNALKGEVHRLSAANQQMSATIASLQTQQRELQQRVATSYTTTHLFSDPRLLKMQIVAGYPSVVTGGTARRATTGTQGRSAAPNRPAPKSDSAPLALAPR